MSVSGTGIGQKTGSRENDADIGPLTEHGRQEPRELPGGQHEEERLPRHVQLAGEVVSERVHAAVQRREQHLSEEQEAEHGVPLRHRGWGWKKCKNALCSSSVACIHSGVDNQTEGS